MTSNLKEKEIMNKIFQDSERIKSKLIINHEDKKDELIDSVLATKNLLEMKSVLINAKHYLKENAKNTVFSDGNSNSEIMIIGEAPGAKEDEKGLPFVGESGMMLDFALSFLDIFRKKDFYITNVIPWRPLNNRTPSDEEILFFKPILEHHVKIFQPKKILLLGSVACKAMLSDLFGTKIYITKIRGNYYERKINNRFFKIFVTYHPAYLLRQPKQKKVFWSDLITFFKDGEK